MALKMETQRFVDFLREAARQLETGELSSAQVRMDMPVREVSTDEEKWAWYEHTGARTIMVILRNRQADEEIQSRITDGVVHESMISKLSLTDWSKFGPRQLERIAAAVREATLMVKEG